MKNSKTKKILSILLAVMMVLGMIPVTSLTAFAAAGGEVYVGGVCMNDGDYLAVGATATQTSQPSGGYAYYKDGTLTLNNYSYEGKGYNYATQCALIYSNADLTIELVGDNTLIQTAEHSDSIRVEERLIINGTGSLTSSDNRYGIYATKWISIRSGTIVVNSKVAGIFCEADAAIGGGDVTVTGGTYGIYVEEENFTINGGDVTATGGMYGIYVGEKQITVKGGTATIEGSSQAFVGRFAYDSGLLHPLATFTKDGPLVNYYSEYKYEYKKLVVLPYIYVGGVKVIDGTYLANGATETTTTKPSGGYAYYKDGTLTLNNYSYEGKCILEDETHYTSIPIIDSKGDLTIELVGNNTLIQTYENSYGSEAIHVGIDSSELKSLTIGGTGTLTANSVDLAIEVRGDMTVNSGTIVATGDKSGIVVDGKVTNNGGNITAIGGKYVGIRSGCYLDTVGIIPGGVFVNSGKVTAVGPEYAIADGYGDNSEFGDSEFIVADGMKIWASTTVNGALGEYVAANLDSYKKIVIESPAINTVNVSATWSGTPANATTSTTGATVTATKWYKKNGSGWTELGASDTIEEGYTYRCEVTVAATNGYTLEDGYTVKINGEDASRNEDGTWDFVARTKLRPIIEKDTYFVQSGTTVELEVDAYGDGVTYSWTGVSDGAGGYFNVTDYTERIQKLEIPEGAEGTNKYLVRFTDEYGDTAERMITVHITSMGFKEIKPTPTAEEFEAGVTDYGYVFPGADGSGVPKVYFEAYELSQSFIDEGYTMETSLIDYVDGVKVGEGYEAWDYTTSLPGAHEIVQKIVIKDAEGNVFKEYTYTHKMNVMREFALLTAAYGTALYGYRVEVYQDGKLASEQINGNDITMDVVAPVGDVKIVVSKNGYKAREYEATIPADGFFSLNAEILRWGDANLDDVLDVQDYQQTINKGLSDNHKLDGSYEQSVMDWAEDGYIDVIDCFYCILCINGTELFSASVEYDKYYGTGGETIKIPVTADGFGITYEWVAPEGAPAIVDGSEDEATVKIGIESGKYNIGDKFTYTCIVRDRFFSYAELEVEVEIESLNNLYAVTFSSQYEDVTGLPGKTRVKAGESITIPELIPQLEGYTFMYWYAGSDRLNPGDTYTPYQNTIIMPYMAKDYEITLYSGIEGELFGTHIGNYGHYYYLPEMDVLPEGYAFYGWTTVEGSNEVEYKAGDRYTIKGDVSFYPVIAKADDVKLTIYANDGTDRVIYSTTLAEQNGEIYFTIPEDLEMPTREGYVCTGFITSPDGYYYGVDKYWQGSKVAANPAGVVLYAHWELPNVLQFKGGMDGVIGLPDSVSFESPQSYQITSWLTPYCDGYEFLYWEDEEGNQYRPDDYVVVYGITTLTAVWEKIDTENYEIWISGQKVSKANPVVQCGDGTATVVADSWGNASALILDNATITGTEGIRTEYNSLTIEVYGENTITVEGENARGITGPNGNIKLIGPGSLDVNVEGDGAIGIKGLYSIDYATVNVNAEAETSDGKAYGVSCLSGGQYRITIDNGATLNATATTYGIYNAGQLKVSKTSSVYAEGAEYGIYDVREIVDAWGGYSSGTVVAVGDVAAMYFDSSFGFPYQTLTNSEAYYGKNTAGLNLSAWDGKSDFIDTSYATYGNKYIEIVPKACTGEHTYTTYSGLEATCDKDGLTDGEYCYTCGYVKTEREYIEAEGHDYRTHNGKDATCTEQGIKGSYTQCDNCGEYKGSVTFIDATGHSWGEWILVEGTDTWYEENGFGERLYVRFCNNCDVSDTRWYTYYDQNDKTSAPSNDDAGGKPW